MGNRSAAPLKQCRAHVEVLEKVTIQISDGPSGERMWRTGDLYVYTIRRCTGDVIQGGDGYETWQMADLALAIYLRLYPCTRCDYRHYSEFACKKSTTP